VERLQFLIVIKTRQFLPSTIRVLNYLSSIIIKTLLIFGNKNRRMSEILWDTTLLNARAHSELHFLFSYWWVAVWNLLINIIKPGEVLS
jgi:hypothetical protein